MTTNLAAVEARAITDRIKATVSDAWDLIEQAYATRVWDALGYDSWDHYCLTEFGTTRLRLPRDERREVITSMRGIGMSTRAIASAIGMDDKTVRNDLANPGAENSAPAVPPARKEPMSMPTAESAESALAPLGTPVPIVTGTDGKTYAAQRSAAETPKAKRRPLPAALTDATHDLLRDAEKLARLTQDDRFAQNRKETHHQLPDLLAALGHTVELVRIINPADADTSKEARRWWATSLRNLSDALTGIANSIEQEK